MAVHGVAHRICRPLFLKIDVGNLTQGMHTCICSPCPVRRQVLPAKGVQGLPEPSLDGWAIVLNLPAHIGRAFIFDGEHIAGHGSGRCPFERQRSRPISAKKFRSPLNNDIADIWRL